jgi:hypothetical protein
MEAGEIRANKAVSMTELHPTAPKLRWYQYSLRTLLIAVTLIGMFIGYAANYGFGTAIAFGVLISLVWFWIVRAIRRWSTLRLWQRLYAIVVGVIVSYFFIAFIVVVATDPSFVRQRNARHLQRLLDKDVRFPSIRVEYRELKDKVLRVDGQVESDRDFNVLRKMILSYDWRNNNDKLFGIHWNVTVCSPKREYHGWDDDLFSDGKR